MRFLISSPGGDIEAGARQLSLPYRIGLVEEHPFLTLGDWFYAAQSFLVKNFNQPGSPIQSGGNGPSPAPAGSIRSEKHGALYHVARVELDLGKGLYRACLLSALSCTAKKWLYREFETITMLGKAFALDYLPAAFLLDQVELEQKGMKESFLFALTEWLEGYHEWHIAGKDCDGRDTISIWDGKGRTAAGPEVHSIYRQASRILTNYFNVESLCQIGPWHHAAGDFVVGSKNAFPDVKLTSARGYSPSALFSGARPKDPWTGLVFFMLELSVRMRLDKIEGTGDCVLASPLILPAVVSGFFEGLLDKEKRQELCGLSPVDFLNLVRGFTRDEYAGLLECIKDLLAQEDPSDHLGFSENLYSHAGKLLEALRSFRPGDHPGVW